MKLVLYLILTAAFVLEAVRSGRRYRETREKLALGCMISAIAVAAVVVMLTIAALLAP